MLTNIAMLEKGRLAEIEALYIALSGIAIVCWLSWWLEKRSPWLTWLLPFIVLGLALLAKGPLHLLFFYAVVVAVLTYAREVRETFNAAHGVGVLLMLAIFALWAVPLLRETSGVAEVWTGQFAGRISGRFDLRGWLTNIPRGLVNLLPWVLLVPLLWRRDIELSPRENAMLRGARLAVLVCFFGLLIIPGVLPRYTLPLTVPLSLALAIALRDPLPQRVRLFWRAANQLFLGAVIVFAIAAPFYADEPLLALAVTVLVITSAVFALARPAFSGEGLAITTAAMFAMIVAVAAVTVVPRMRLADNVRPFGEAVNAALPERATLHVADAGFQPALFYLKRKIRYIANLNDLPQRAHYVFLPSEKLGNLQKRRRINIRASFVDKEGNRFLLCSIEPL
jgi:4-amino-4-deoxy-L-arabinose transferase-like glycosyltransferase